MNKHKDFTEHLQRHQEIRERVTTNITRVLVAAVASGDLQRHQEMMKRVTTTIIRASLAARASGDLQHHQKMMKRVTTNMDSMIRALFAALPQMDTTIKAIARSMSKMASIESSLVTEFKLDIPSNVITNMDSVIRASIAAQLKMAGALSSLPIQLKQLKLQSHLHMNNQESFKPILTSDEQAEGTKRKRELIKLVASGDAMLIVGAGSSMRVGYPGWPDLIKELEGLANESGDGFEPDKEGSEDDPLAYVEDIKSHICKETDDLEQYYALLYKLFKPKPIPFDDFHKKLVSLPFRGILTTNYDTVLELALLEKKREADVKEKTSLIDETSLIIGMDSPRLIHEFLLARNNDPQTPQQVAHIHGMYRWRDSIILSSNDYIEAYGLHIDQDGNHQRSKDRWTLHRKLLWAILATRRAVFIGFSMNDPYFNAMLETVSKDLWGWDESIHYAIMDISPKDAEHSKNRAKDRKNKYGVDTVFYEDFDGSHKGLEHIVNYIYEECRAEQSTIMSQDRGGDNRSEDEKPKPIAGESQDVLDWFERVNERMERSIDDEN